MTFYKKEAKVMLSPVKVKQSLKDSIIGVSAQKEKNYTDTMIYLLELGVKSHLMDNINPIGRQEFEPKREEGKPAAKKAPVKRFAKPNLVDIQEYFKEKGVAGIEYDKFHDFYESNGWKVGKNPMKDWKAAARNWMKNKSGGGFNAPKPDRLATPDRTELFNEMGVGEAPFYNPLTIEG